MKQQDISYALSKQVPDMARGFTIHTNYGDITIEAGWMADRISDHVTRTLQSELLHLTRQEQHARVTEASV